MVTRNGPQWLWSKSQLLVVFWSRWIDSIGIGGVHDFSLDPNGLLWNHWSRGIGCIGIEVYGVSWSREVYPIGNGVCILSWFRPCSPRFGRRLRSGAVEVVAVTDVRFSRHLGRPACRHRCVRSVPGATHSGMVGAFSFPPFGVLGPVWRCA